MNPRHVYASMVVFDTQDIRLSVADTEELIRQDLIELYNDNAVDGEIATAPNDTTLSDLKQMWWDEQQIVVITEKTWVAES